MGAGPFRRNCLEMAAERVEGRVPRIDFGQVVEPC